MESIFLTYPAIFAFVGAALVLGSLQIIIPRVRFFLMLGEFALASAFILTLYFLGARVEEMLLVGFGLFILSLICYLIAKKKEEAKA